MKLTLLIILIIYIGFSCRFKQDLNINNDSDTIHKMIQIDKFRFTNKLNFDKAEYRFDTSNYKISDLNKLEDTLIMKNWFGLDYFNFYDIYYYSIQNKTNDIQPLTFLKEGADYSSIILLLIDSHSGKLINSIELYGGDEEGPLNNKTNQSNFINDSTFILNEIHRKCDSFFIGANVTIDTIKYRYQINRLKGFDIVKFDSIRSYDKIK